MKQNNTRKSSFLNKYGMSPEEIFDKFSAKNVKGIKKGRLARPQKQIVAAQKNNLNLLTSLPYFKLSSHSEYPVPDYFKKKSIEVSIIIPMYKSNEVIKSQIENWTDEDVDYEIIYVDDHCPLNSKEIVLFNWNKKKQSVGKIIYTSENNGYGGACNIGAHYASGKYLILLNADTRPFKGWLKPIIDLLKDESVGIVGNLQIKEGGAFHDFIDSAGSEWSWEKRSFVHIGRNIYKGKELPIPFKYKDIPSDLNEVSEREMVTGCCIGIRKDLFKEIGGFNPNYRIGYWEDSELCMTVKEKGYKILYQPNSVIYHKGSHTGSGNHKYIHHNATYFSNKWIKSNRIDDIIGNKRPKEVVNSILIKRQTSRGDSLIAASVASALKKKHPGVKISFVTSDLEIVYKNPYIDNSIKSHDPRNERLYDIFYDLDLCYEYRPHSNILDCYADAVGVKKEDCNLFIHDDPTSLVLPADYIVLHCDKTNWVGRNWTTSGFQEVISKLKEMKENVVLIGNSSEEFKDIIDFRNLNIFKTANIIKRSKLFFGIDSFPFHIAQTFNVPSVIFFGSINPKTRIISNNVSAVVANGLNCLGCHHEQPMPCFSTTCCKINEELCQSLVSPESILQQIKERLKNGT